MRLLVHSWRELAAAALEGTAEPPAPIALSDEVRAGIAALRRMAPPPGAASDEVWRQIVADAVTIERRGWADQALALGWDPLDLFGCGWAGERIFEGLAVWLAGRSVVLLDARSAIVADGRERAIFYRRPFASDTNHSRSPVFLWSAGGGR
jgi:hypothetical protein